MIRAYAPASIGNFAAGFDILGAAISDEEDPLRLGDIVTIEPAYQTSFEVTGPYAHLLPGDPADNLVVRARDRVAAGLAARGAELRPHKLVLHKRLPLNSGLGSSAASIVAGLLAVNAFADDVLDKHAMYRVAGELEGAFSGGVHYDNTGPALVGGLLLIAPDGPPHALPFPDDLRVVVVHPELELSTAASRAALPREFPRPRVVEFAQNLALLVHALHSGDRDLLRSALRDPLAEPHRAPLVTGFDAVKRSALDAGALGSSLSGSGPSVFAVCERDRAARVRDAMVAAFSRAGVRADGFVCALDVGARRI